MSKTALVINGTARGNGNTDILVNKIIEGATDAGVSITLTELRKKIISNCIGCYRCMKDSICSLQDDMTEIRDTMHTADVMILASPLYWWGVTGSMKTFIDRLFLYYHSRNKPLISGKNAVIVTPLAEDDVASTADLLVEFYTRLCDRLEVNIAEMVFFEGLMDKRIVWERPKFLEKAYALGENISKL